MLGRIDELLTRSNKKKWGKVFSYKCNGSPGETTAQARKYSHSFFSFVDEVPIILRSIRLYQNGENRVKIAVFTLTGDISRKLPLFSVIF